MTKQLICLSMLVHVRIGAVFSRERFKKIVFGIFIGLINGDSTMDSKQLNKIFFSLVYGITLSSAGYAVENPQAQPAGAFEDRQRVYYPQQCAHNGNRAVCTFAFVNQGALATVLASPSGGYAELSGVQLVDDAHVPHNADLTYFLDRYGNRQNSMTLNKGDQAAYVVEFPGVDSHVTAAQFQRTGQIVGPVAVATPPPTQVVNAPTTAQAVPTSLSLPGVQGGMQPQAVGQQAVAIQQPAASYPPGQNAPQQLATYPAQNAYQQQAAAVQQAAAYQQQYAYPPPQKDAVTKANERAQIVQGKAQTAATVATSAATVAQGAASVFSTFKGMLPSSNSTQSNNNSTQPNNNAAGQNQ